jgi:hypothetical protein
VVRSSTAIWRFALRRDAARETDLVAWLVTMRIPDGVTARLITSAPSPYVLQAESLEELRGLLPAGLERFDRSANDPAEVIEH